MVYVTMGTLWGVFALANDNLTWAIVSLWMLVLALDAVNDRGNPR